MVVVKLFLIMGQLWLWSSYLSSWISYLSWLSRARPKSLSLVKLVNADTGLCVAKSESDNVTDTMNYSYLTE